MRCFCRFICNVSRLQSASSRAIGAGGCSSPSASPSCGLFSPELRGAFSVVNFYWSSAFLFVPTAAWSPAISIICGGRASANTVRITISHVLVHFARLMDGPLCVSSLQPLDQVMIDPFIRLLQSVLILHVVASRFLHALPTI